MTSTLQTLAFKLAPPPREVGPEPLDPCDLGTDRQYEVVPSVVCSMCCLFGIIYCFFDAYRRVGDESVDMLMRSEESQDHTTEPFLNCEVSAAGRGYRCFKAVLFLTGLMFGSVVVFLLCYKERVLDTQLSAEASAGIGLGIGTLCGLVTMLVRSVGLFMVGLLLGLLAGIGTLVGMEELSSAPPRSVWVPLGVLLGLGMLFAVLTLQWQRFFTTLSTAAFGAAVIAVAADYFVELFALVRYIYERVKAVPARSQCWVTWAVLGAWPALALLGALVQWRVTAEGYSHTKVMISRQQRRVQLMRIRQKEERRECSRKKRRKQQSQHHTHSGKAMHPDPPYRRKPQPVRRYDGDVLSPSYIQSFRERQGEGCAYPGARLSGAHTAVDIDYDCGSTVPLTSGAVPNPRV